MSEPTLTSAPAPRKRGDFFSARFFLRHGLLLVCLFVVAQLAGLREHTTFLTGTSGSPDVSVETSAIYGLIYILTYLCCVVVAPIFLLTAGLLVLWQKFQQRKTTG
jgi:hypothetical protein